MVHGFMSQDVVHPLATSHINGQLRTPHSVSSCLCVDSGVSVIQLIGIWMAMKWLQASCTVESAHIIHKYLVELDLNFEI